MSEPRTEYTTEIEPAVLRRLAAVLTGECRRDALAIAEDLERAGSHVIEHPGYRYTFRRPSPVQPAADPDGLFEFATKMAAGNALIANF